MVPSLLDLYSEKCLYSLSSIEGEWHEFEHKLERAKKRRKVEENKLPASSSAPGTDPKVPE